MYKIKNILIVAMAFFLILGTGRIAIAAGKSAGHAIGGSQIGATKNKESGIGQTTEQGFDAEQKKGNTEAYQAKKQEFNLHREQVRLNTEDITRIRAQIKDCSEDLKLLIQNRIQNRDNISAGEMLRYQAMIQTLKQERGEILSEHQGKIQEQVALMSQARLLGDIEAANTAMNNIRTEQLLRLVELTKVWQDLNDLLESN